ncbi:hypothetical protein SELMODRAFT_410212 [Selaginella moellendorffii]|uniref:Roadblock/LAMTOR2 domain-containing protein n=1 Tax=Selaginella moellendorffii TaxID=88036 RepID=D8RE02_SELML|nr:hypothetical protein SELMODRAFT_410212 [Selaginella moellendorffii]
MEEKEQEEAPAEEEEEKAPVIVEVKKKEPHEFSQAKYHVEETVKKISSHRGILGTIVTDSLGIPITSTMDDQTTARYSSYMVPLATKAKDLIHDIESKDQVRLLRVRTKVHEIVVVPDGEFYVIVVQLTK